MQTFDGELEKLILKGELDREVGLSFATNRTNLQLKLETEGGGKPSEEESIGLAPSDSMMMPRTGTGSHRSPGGGGQGARKPSATGGGSDIDDLIER